MFVYSITIRVRVTKGIKEIQGKFIDLDRTFKRIPIVESLIDIIEDNKEFLESQKLIEALNNNFAKFNFDASSFGYPIFIDESKSHLKEDSNLLMQIIFTEVEVIDN